MMFIEQERHGRLLLLALATVRWCVTDVHGFYGVFFRYSDRVTLAVVVVVVVNFAVI